MRLNRINAQAGFAQVLFIIILLIGLVVGLILVQQTQIFKPQAANAPAEWVQSNGQDPNNCVTTQSGQTVTTCPKVQFKLTPPINQSSDASFEIIKTAHAAEFNRKC